MTLGDRHVPADWSFRLEETETVETYKVVGVPKMRDERSSMFTPEAVMVTHRDVPMWLTIRGRRDNGKVTTTYFRVLNDGTIQPHDRNGPAPDWLHRVLEIADPTRLGKQ